MNEHQRPGNSEAEVLGIFDNQFPSLTNQMVSIVRQLSAVNDKWPSILLLVLGASLLVIAVLMKIEIRGARIANLSALEFITMLVVSASLLLAGALFRMLQSRNLREILKAQQKLGAEILNKQVDMAGKPKKQVPLLIVSHARMRKSMRLLN